MAQANTATAARPTLKVRTGATPKQATDTAIQAAGTTASSAPQKANFRVAELSAAATVPAVTAVAPSASSAAALTTAPVVAAPVPWSAEDETNYQTLLARRKAAGHKRRGSDLSTQVLQLGTIKPNPDTIVATIVSIVAGRGQLSRAELIKLMGAAPLPNPKARPDDKGWCQGYISGAIRNGFLAVVPAPTPGGEA